MNQGWAPLPSPPQAPMPQYYGDVPPPPPQKPSGIYKALGIVQLSLGAIGVLYSLFSMGSMGLVAAFGHASSRLMTSGLMIFSFVRSASSVLTGAMLIGTGIGVYRAKRWSRPLGLTYAGVSLFATIAGTALYVLVLQQEVYGKMHGSAARELTLFTTISSLVSAFVASILPVVTLVMLLRAAARTELDQ